MQPWCSPSLTDEVADNANVVVTGMGMRSPLGVTEQEHVTALQSSRSGLLEGQHAFLRVFGHVPDFDASRSVSNRKLLKLMNRQTVLACCASADAVREARIDNATLSCGEDALVFGSTAWQGSLLSLRSALGASMTDEGAIDFRHLAEVGYRNLAPLWILPLLPNTTAGQIAIMHGLRGLNLSVVNGPSSGFVAVGEAFTAVRQRRYPRALTGGSEGEVFADLYARLRARGYASDTMLASMPFANDADGFAPAEGAAALFLETEESALARGVRPRARIRGFINRYVPRFRNASISEIALAYARTMRSVLAAADWDSTAVDFVQASACGIPKIDHAEALAIAAVFGSETQVTSIHGATGNCLAAAGPLAIICAVLQLDGDFISPILRTKELFAGAPVNYVHAPIQKRCLRRCLVNCFDYMGEAACMLIERSEMV